MVARASVLREVMMVGDGHLEFSSDLFEYSELKDFIKSLHSKIIYILSRLIISLIP